MQFTDIYQREIRLKGYQPTTSQKELVALLEPVWQQLNQPVWQRHHSRSVYIWGPVGRGKTFLMDLLFLNIPEGRALRLHFHRFLSRIHQDMHRLQGQKNPVQQIAQELAGRYQLICFDEFFLDDIADAMILRHLLDALFEHGTCLITTSNRPPDKLCKDTLFEDRIRPAIRSIHQHMEVFNLDDNRDHRLRELNRNPTIFSSTEYQKLQELFLAINGFNAAPQNYEIHGRQVKALGVADDAVWFDFSEICGGPRSQLDYIWLTDHFRTIFISDIPGLSGKASEQIKARGTEDGSVAVHAGRREVLLGRMDDATRRFISLVDEAYDRGTNLYLSMDLPLDQLYTEGSLTFEFARTISRLTEMQSTEYQNS